LIKSLQSIRFFSILIIFLFHSSVLVSEEHIILYNRFFSDGYVGTIFFMVLSGFVVAYNYYNKMHGHTVKDSISFVKKRMKRIYPLHVLTFMIAAMFIYKEIISSPIKSIVRAFFNLTLIQSFVPNLGIGLSYNAPSWYLSTTLFFYLATPLLFELTRKINEKKINIWFVIVIVYSFQFLIVFVGRDSTFNNWLFYVNPFFSLLSYYIGILLGIIGIDKLKTYNGTVVKYTLLELLSIILFIIAYYLNPYINQSFRYEVYYLPFAAFIIYTFAIQKGYLSKFISNKLLVYLGNISFEFYIVHQLMIRLVYKYVNINVSITRILISFVFTLIISAIVHKINKTKKTFHTEIKGNVVAQ